MITNILLNEGKVFTSLWKLDLHFLIVSSHFESINSLEDICCLCLPFPEATSILEGGFKVHIPCAIQLVSRCLKVFLWRWPIGWFLTFFILLRGHFGIWFLLLLRFGVILLLEGNTLLLFHFGYLKVVDSRLIFALFNGLVELGLL